MPHKFNAAHLRDATRRGRDAAAARGAERNQKLGAALTQLASYILSLRPSDEELTETATKNPKWSSICLWWCRPPSKNRDTGDSMHPADETHFSGWVDPGAGKDPRDGLKDPTKDGYPAIGLCQGFPKQRGDRKGDPSTLPGGKVLAIYINEMLLNEAGGDPDQALAARAVWNPKDKKLEMHLIWNIPDFEKWQRGLRQKQEDWRVRQDARRAAEREVAAAEAKTMTLDEHMRRKPERKEVPQAAPAPDEPETEETLGGFKVVRRKQRKPRN